MSVVPPQRTARRPGRPRHSSSEDTRARILDAALSSFAKSGFEGARLKEIADAADVHTALVHHYFGDKGRLYNAVMERALGPLKESGTGLLIPDMDIKDIIEGFVSLMTYFFRERREVVLLVTREALSGAERLRPIIKDTLRPLFDQAIKFFEEARKTGRVPDLDPAHMVITVVGAVGLYFTHQAVVAQILEGDPLSEELVERRRVEVTRMLLALLQPPRSE
ncbi:MAG: TetR/AcrR family transcriptional regulator [Myxococcota bacterium]